MIKIFSNISCIDLELEVTDFLKRYNKEAINTSITYNGNRYILVLTYKNKSIH